MDGGADVTGRREGTLRDLSEKIGQAPEITLGSGIASRVVTSLLQVMTSSITVRSSCKQIVCRLKVSQFDSLAFLGMLPSQVRGSPGAFNMEIP
jgi:hypothetical protein